MFWAHLDTSNFKFDAFGGTHEDAEVAMVQLTREHCEKRSVNWAEFYFGYWDALGIHEVKVGSGFRDNDPVFDRAEWEKRSGKLTPRHVEAPTEDDDDAEG